jgi:hypothetical protein
LTLNQKSGGSRPSRTTNGLLMELEDIPFKGAKVITCVPIEQNNFIAGSRPVKTTKYTRTGIKYADIV